MKKHAKGYLHGYTKDEQQRLYEQARFLEHSVYRNIDFSSCSHIVEIGCGVGAQTEILLRRFPKPSIAAIDASPEQIERARVHLKEEVAAARVTLTLGDATKLPYVDDQFDGAFLCWILEHVADPLAILKEAHRVLSPGGVVYCTEVLNATFYVHPYSPATLKYWFEFNDHQWSLGGDPFVGAKLANLLLAAGFQDVTTQVMSYHYDNRMPKRRAEFIEYWTELLLSGAPGLVQAKRVTEATVKKMRTELRCLQDDPDAVFFYAGMQARAYAL